MNLDELRPLLWPALLIAGVVVGMLWMQKRGWVDARPNRVRRGTGHAMLGLQEFIEPSVEHIFQAENLEQKDVEDADAAGEGPEVILEDLAECLADTPVEPEAVRRILAIARSSGLDWQGLYDQAVRDELAARPYRSPAVPPSWRVAPGEG